MNRGPLHDVLKIVTHAAEIIVILAELGVGLAFNGGTISPALAVQLWCAATAFALVEWWILILSHAPLSLGPEGQSVRLCYSLFLAMVFALCVVTSPAAVNFPMLDNILSCS